MPMVILKRSSVFFVERGNNLIFIDSIQSIEGPEAKLGDSVIVCDPSWKLVGWGVFNPRSVYRVRMMQSVVECQRNLDAVFNIGKVFAYRLEAAMKLRSALGLPSTETTAYRCINSDGDQLSGVIVDRFGDVAVVHSGVCWLELHREQIVEQLKSTLAIETVVWRLRPVIKDQEGFPAAKEAIYSQNADLTMDSEIEIFENGVKFAMALSGQKTGFYSDQRENRLFLRSVARGKRVLDLCCYTGGFALNAAIGGAVEVLGIDSSQAAVDLAQRNAEANNVESICRFECSDILNRLEHAVEVNESWDVVVLDPPKLAFAKSHLEKSLSRYRKLNRAAMGVVKRGGLFVSCSCSGSIDRDRFVKAVWEAAEQIQRRLTIVRLSGAAADHVYDLNHPEGSYLKCLVARVL